ncbi:dystrophin-like isoform X2 [Xenia sp. Carnegie-2017]|uniref:dystrophin-like isoform X2 n=1 Tax=Xenia sp. Carnegie-2017 TaxID=2897299 RepID=UPI001F042DA5|nr:dystrophin-like isoform X2 [Xenia sp. Carnegie-2017]
MSGSPADWKKAETLAGVPYYINHVKETTQWDHPELTQLKKKMTLTDYIKYGAYRTAVKLRQIQKKIQVDSVYLSAIRGAMNNLGYEEEFTEDKINVAELQSILYEIFQNEFDRGNDVVVNDAVELTLNWLLSVYDQARSGLVRIISVKLGLCCLSAASVQEKYKFFFDQIAYSKGFIDKKRLRLFTKDVLQILKYIKEYHCFGRFGIEPTVNSCFDRAFVPERITFKEFLDWMIDEPQTLVWLPTLHRLALSETVKHEGKCNICKMFPIVGFRYRCLKCFNFDICQNCFWSARVAKNHKVHHQMQEYCLPATQKEDLKDFTKVFKTKFLKKKKEKNTSGLRYLPITCDEFSDSSETSDEWSDEVDGFDSESETCFGSYEMTAERHNEHDMTTFNSSRLKENSPPTTSTPLPTSCLDNNQVKEMEEIVQSLENDNKYLRGKIMAIQQEFDSRHYSLQSMETVSRKEIDEYNERLEAKQEVLNDHNRRLQQQLDKLRHLLHQNAASAENISNESQRYLPMSNIPNKPTPLPKFHDAQYSFFAQSAGHNGTFQSLSKPKVLRSVNEELRKYGDNETRTSDDHSTSLSSDEDLREIKVELEEILEMSSSV